LFITLLRHGESEGNSLGVLQGQSDYPLTPIGSEQARELASIWKSEGTKFDLIMSSPLRRASQTAEILATSLDVPLEFDPLWKERNFGHLQDMQLDEINKIKPPLDFFHPYAPIGGTGESQLDLYNRASQALQSILRRPDGAYLVVSHGGILNKALFVIMGITPQAHYNSLIFRFGNTGYAQFSYNSPTRQWAMLGFTGQIKKPQTGGFISWKND
jgi:2,3-bisphosphoglycerate-dependent phosphoglycerate mutase